MLTVLTDLTLLTVLTVSVVFALLAVCNFTHTLLSYTHCALHSPECDEYIRIFEYSNIFDPNIYSDIRSYLFLDTNVFGYSFVSKSFI